MLGPMHAEAIAEFGGIPVLADVNGEQAEAVAMSIVRRYGVDAIGVQADVTSPTAITGLLDQAIDKYGRIDILVNNAAHNPTMGSADAGARFSRLENLPLEVWERDIAVGLTGALICSRILGSEMAKRGKGVILNIASDLGLIAPDQRVYREPSLNEDEQPVKPVSYSVVKHGLIGLTRYLATYWADRGVRVNALCPGGVYDGQDQEFVNRLAKLVPLGRMANKDEYKGAVVFLCSDASSYMTGANLIIDGGRTSW